MHPAFLPLATFFSNALVSRFLTMSLTSLLVLVSAAGCTLPGLNGIGGGGKSALTLGVLKRDPELKKDGFGRINAVETGNGTDQTGLSSSSGLKIQQANKENLFLLTREKGLFQTKNAGRTWERVYIFPIKVTETKTKDKNGNDRDKTPAEIQTETNSKIAQNDKFKASDFLVDPQNGQNIYLAGSLEKIGKVYQSSDGGASFREIYTETNPVGVRFINLDPRNNNKIYIVLEGGAMMRSQDAGQTWQKIRSFDDAPIQVGFVPEFNNVFFVLFAKQGLATSQDDGQTWQIQTLSKEASRIGERQAKDGLDVNILDKNNRFGTYEKVVPVTTSSSPSWLLIADRQIWYLDNLSLNLQPTTPAPSLPSVGRNQSASTSVQPLPNGFNKLVLPLQAEKYNILDVTFDPRLGLDKIQVSVDDKLFETQNRGLSWSLKDKIQLSTKIGNIGQILIDKTNSEVIYLMLIDPKAKRANGTFAA